MADLPLEAGPPRRPYQRTGLDRSDLRSYAREYARRRRAERRAARGLPPFDPAAAVDVRATCHPDRRHHARGLCMACYLRWRRAQRASANCPLTFAPGRVGFSLRNG